MQCVIHGVVKGLALSADFTQADPVLWVAPGYGISAAGEDVALDANAADCRRVRFRWIDPVERDGDRGVPGLHQLTRVDNNYVGVILLQPIVGQVGGTSGVDTGTVPTVVLGNLDASCDQDPEEYAFGRLADRGWCAPGTGGVALHPQHADAALRQPCDELEKLTGLHRIVSRKWCWHRRAGHATWTCSACRWG